MEKRNEKKYRIEKVLHEILRDLPEARKISDAFENGTITDAEALGIIARIIERVRG